MDNRREKDYEWVMYGVKKLGALALFCYLLWLFEHNYIEAFGKHVVSTYFQMPVWLARILTLITTGLIITKACLVCIYKQRVRWEYVGPLTLAITIVYIRYRFVTDDFYAITEPLLRNKIAYVDIVQAEYYILLLITLCVEIATCQKRRKQLKMLSIGSAYMDDTPADAEEEDELKYSVRAQNIAKEIMTLPLNHSWSIGIVGLWGSGKSSFINFITNHLPKNEYCVITFNPRMAASVGRIQEQALTILEENLRIYNTDLFALIHRYMAAMKIADTSRWVQLLTTLFRGPEDSERLKQRLDEVLRKLPVRVVYVIEDFDRLTKEEIIEVLKLIDGNAKFSNIIYLAAYDYSYVDRLFSYDATHQHYISKYFNIEHHVPFRPSNYIREYMVKDLSRKPLLISDEGYAQTPNMILESKWTLMQPYLQTLRDAKRYLNLLRSDYLQVETEVDLEDFMLITLLKYSDIATYESVFFYPDRYFKKGSQIVYIDSKEGNSILRQLFPDTKEQSRRPRRIRDNNAFLTYFVAEIYSLPIAEMTKVIRQDFRMSKKQIQEWIKNGKIGDFVQFLYFNYKWFIRSDEELYNYVDISLMLLHEFNEPMQLPDMRTLFTDEMWTGMSAMYKDKAKREDYKNHLLEKLRATEWNRGDLHMIARLVPELSEKEDKYIVKLSDITEICEQQLELKVRHNVVNPTEETYKFGMSLLSTCVVSETKEGVKLRPTCCRMVRNMIDNEPKYYIRDFVKISNPKATEGTHEVYCEEYWEQIFGGTTEMEEFLKRKDYDAFKQMNRNRNFWELYKANEYKSFKITVANLEANMESYDFAKEIKALEQLREYQEKYKEIMAMTDRRSERINKLIKLEQLVQTVPLNIKLKGKISKDINQNQQAIIPKANLYRM